jgi:hypothetical protein
MTPPALILASGAVIAVGSIVAFHHVSLLPSWSALLPGNALPQLRVPVADRGLLDSLFMNLTSHPDWRCLLKTG